MVRHPLYGGLLLASFGVAGLTDSAIRAAFAVLLFPILHERARLDEIALHEKFGTDWTNYSKNTKPLLPFLDIPFEGERSVLTSKIDKLTK